MGVAGLAHYCAAKAGVVGLTRALAVELAPVVRVNAVCPGPIDTPMLRGGLAQEADPQRALREKAATVPLGRLADPAEVAAAIFFLAFLPQFVVDGKGPAWAQLLLHGSLIIVVAAFAAWADGTPATAITPTRRRTRSAASVGSRSG